MDTEPRREKRILEIMLIVLMLGMTTLYYKLGEHQLVALNLFFLPVVLGGYYLGRANAGVLALCCALFVTIAATLSSTGFVGYDSPVMMGLALTIWAAVLGLTALLVGTLCDERARTVNELQKAYVGIVDVLSRYLQSADPQVKARSTRVAELSQMVAQELRLSRKQIDDIRVAALLHDLASIEITAHLISNAVSALEAGPAQGRKYTFLGADLVHSLGSVLDGALPLLASQLDGVQDCLPSNEDIRHDRVPLGAKIISAVRAYDALTSADASLPRLTPDDALNELRTERAGHDDLFDALERAVRESSGAVVFESAQG